MKNPRLQYVAVVTLAILLHLSFLTGCREKPGELYNQIHNYLDGISVIDTHEHHGFPWKSRHHALDLALYLYADLVSAGMPEITDSLERIYDSEAVWNHISPYLRFTRGSSYYAQLLKNLQEMHGLPAGELSREDFLRISDDVNRNFRNYGPWLDSGLNRLKIDFMLTDRLWDPFNPVMEHQRSGYVFRFDRLVTDAVNRSGLHRLVQEASSKLLKTDPAVINTLDDYLVFIDHVFEALQVHQVYALKMGLAYHRHLNFREVPLEKARALFADGDLSPENQTVLQDYLVNYIIGKAGKAGIPIQIHTGYLHGNYGDLNRGNPVQLIPLIRRNPQARFVLFHLGYPWTGECVTMGKHYPNVYLDLVWLPLLSRTRAEITLHELIDAVPYNKICWGGDVGKIDEIAGSLAMAKEVVATVLSERIEKGWLTREAAFDICDRIFRENAIGIYSLSL
jgi:uncharacterized protein